MCAQYEGVTLEQIRIKSMGGMGTESGPKSWVVGESTQGEGVGAMISSKMGRAERSRCTNSAKACLPCCQQVRRTLANI